jgi:DNA-binding GntR family transcriptional regulator
MASSVVTKSISEQITDRLRQQILAGEFQPGCPLREGEIADRYQVSRHPVRKVLQQLTLEGLLVSKPNCGVSVAAETSEHVAELLTPMRVQLELYALRRISSDHFKDHLSDWGKMIRLMARAAEDKDEQAILSLDAEFHQRLLIAAGIEDFIPLWFAIYGRMRGHHRQSNRRLVDLSYVPFVHERLLQSFLTKDIESSSKDLQSHLENTDFNRKAQAIWAKRKQKESK